MPDYLGTPGFLMAIFGAREVALLHINPAVLKPDGYRLLDTLQLCMPEDATPDQRVSFVKLVQIEPTHVSAQINGRESAQFTFMLGWSKDARLE